MSTDMEISIFQNPNFRQSQIIKFVDLMEDAGWMLYDSQDIKEKRKEIQKAQDSWDKVTFQLRNKFSGQIIDLFHIGEEYIISPNSVNNDFDFLNLNDQIYSILRNGLHLNKSICRTKSNQTISWIHTDLYHEGVLIIASSNQLKNYYAQNDFDYEFPKGIEELVENGFIIAILADDESFETVLDFEMDLNKPESFQSGQLKTYGKDDEILLLNHADFTMICDKHKGDYKDYGWKHIISFASPTNDSLNFAIWKAKSGENQKMIFNIDEKVNETRNLIGIQEIPTHNNVYTK